MLPSKNLTDIKLKFHRASALRFFDYATEKLKLHRLQTYVRSTNVRAIKWMEMCYFNREGLLKRYGPDIKDYYVYGRLFNGWYFWSVVVYLRHRLGPSQAELDAISSKREQTSKESERRKSKLASRRIARRRGTRRKPTLHVRENPSMVLTAPQRTLGQGRNPRDNA